MGWILALAGTLAAAAAAAAWLRARRAPPPSPGAAGRPVPDAPPAAAAVPGEGAWVSRLAQTLPAAVRRLADQEASRPESAGGLGLQGNLAQTPLHDLLQYLALGRKSGVLELASGRRTGRIVLAEGRIGRTSYRGKEGMEAAFLMLELAEGDFEFYGHEPRPVSGPAVQPGSGHEGPGGKPADTPASLEVVDLIMLWMARRPKKQRAT